MIGLRRQDSADAGARSSSGWVRLLAGIGLYAVVIHLLQMFVSLGRSVRSPRADVLPEPGSDLFLNTLSATMNIPVVCGGRAELLNDGDDFFPALLEAIHAARHHIHLMTYIWKPGRVSDEVFEALRDRAREGIEVRLMIDGIGSFIAPRHQIRALRADGGQVAVFSPLFSPHFVHLHQRNHRRAFVVDGRVAFTGGISVADQWAGRAEDPDHWRDTMIRATGPMARTIQSAFLHLWTNVTGEHLVDGAYIPPYDAADAESPVRHIGISNSPDPAEQPLLYLFWLTIMCARHRLYIANSYFAPDRHLRRALMERARAGVDVRLLLPSHHTDNALVRWSAHSFYEPFLEAGIRIYEFSPTMMHAKHLVADDRWTVIGSSNIDVRSIRMNQENVLGIVDPDLGRQVLDQFDRDFARSHEVTLDEWRRRPWWYRARESVFTVFRAQY